MMFQGVGFSCCLAGWKRKEKWRNRSSTTNGIKFMRTLETSTVKMINKDGATPETPETPETRLWEHYSRNSRNTLGFGSFGSKLQTSRQSPLGRQPKSRRQTDAILARGAELLLCFFRRRPFHRHNENWWIFCTTITDASMSCCC